MTDRQSTHGHDCWGWGPKHYECAVREIKALRAEVERLRAKTACTMGVGRGDGSLFVHGDYESIKAAQALVLRSEQAEARAERMAEALEDIRSRSSMNLAMHPNPFELTARLGDIYQIADANSND